MFQPLGGSIVCMHFLNNIFFLLFIICPRERKQGRSSKHPFVSESPQSGEGRGSLAAKGSVMLTEFVCRSTLYPVRRLAAGIIASFCLIRVKTKIANAMIRAVVSHKYFVVDFFFFQGLNMKDGRFVEGKAVSIC